MSSGERLDPKGSWVRPRPCYEFLYCIKDANQTLNSYPACQLKSAALMAVDQAQWQRERFNSREHSDWSRGALASGSPCRCLGSSWIPCRSAAARGIRALRARIQSIPTLGYRRTRLSPDKRPTWRSLAAEAGVPFSSEIMWEDLRPVLGGRDGPRPYYVTEGNLDEPARTRLFGVLADASGDKSTFFYYGLAAICTGSEAHLYRAPCRSIRAVEDLAARDMRVPINWENLYGPEYIWPSDRSWVVMTDYDLESTYIACDAALAERLLADDVLEVLPVELTSHINGAR